MTDDTATQPCRSVLAAGAHRRRPVDELGFTDRLHLDRAVGAVHRTALDKNGLGDVLAAAGVGEQFVDQKTVPRAVPQMMVGIDDLQPRLEDLLPPQRQPDRIRVTRAGRRIGSCTGARWLRTRRPTRAPRRLTVRPSRLAMSGAIRIAVAWSFRSFVPSKASASGGR